MALISLDNVSKIYPKGTRPALDDINLCLLYTSDAADDGRYV